MSDNNAVDSTDTEPQMTDVAYVGDSRAEQLSNADIESVADLAMLDIDDITDVVSVGATDAARILDSAAEMVGFEPEPQTDATQDEVDEAVNNTHIDGWGDTADADDSDDDPELALDVEGLSAEMATVLVDNGVSSEGHLAQLDPERVADVLDISEGQAYTIVMNAVEQTGVEPSVPLASYAVSTSTKYDQPLDEFLAGESDDNGWVTADGDDWGDGEDDVFLAGDLDAVEDDEPTNLVVVCYDGFADDVDQKTYNKACSKAMNAFHAKHGWVPETVGMPAGQAGQQKTLKWMTNVVEPRDDSKDHAVFSFETFVDEHNLDYELSSSQWGRIFQGRLDAMMDWADGVAIVVGEEDPSEDNRLGQYISECFDRNLDFEIGDNI